MKRSESPCALLGSTIYGLHLMSLCFAQILHRMVYFLSFQRCGSGSLIRASWRIHCPPQTHSALRRSHNRNQIDMYRRGGQSHNRNQIGMFRRGGQPHNRNQIGMFRSHTRNQIDMYRRCGTREIRRARGMKAEIC